MTFVPGSSLIPRALWRPAMVFIAIAQVLLAFAPLLESGKGGSTSHVEEAGTSIHHSHDEANCAACVARVLLSSSELANRNTLFAVSSAISPAHASVASHAASSGSSLLPRAPPSNRV